VAATLLGGFWRGALACILSAVLAWWLFMSPAFGFALDQGQLVSLITFILVCLLLVGTVTALNAAVDLLLVEIDFRRGAQIALGQLASVAETSEDAIITSWNKGAERIFGYEADEMIGKPINLLIPPDRPDEEPSILARLRKGQRIEHYETVRRRKDGELIDISLSGTFSNVVPMSAKCQKQTFPDAAEPAPPPSEAHFSALVRTSRARAVASQCGDGRGL